MATYKCSYNYCGICGHTPKTHLDEPNRAPVRWWDPDDGWKIGTLCRWCHEDVRNDRPQPDDYAYRAERDAVCSGEPETDEDPTLCL